MADINELFSPTAKTQQDKNNNTNHSSSQTTPARKWKITDKNVGITALVVITLCGAIPTLISFLKNGNISQQEACFLLTIAGAIITVKKMRGGTESEDDDLKKGKK